MPHPLDDPIWSALTGPNAPFGIRHGRAIHFQRDVAPFCAIEEPSEQAYADLAVHLPPGELARMFRPRMEPLPRGWEHVEDFPLLQMVASGVPRAPGRATPRVQALGAQDMPAIHELVALAQPGPFERRTLELGLYLGIWEGSRLVALAGERMRVPGFVELSAICTHPSARHRGFAASLVLHLTRLARERGEIAFLHVASANTPAAMLYEKLGFAVRKELRVLRRRPVRPL
jgi:ribosomal protein S18 acetylase RimI-like enzyme